MTFTPEVTMKHQLILALIPVCCAIGLIYSIIAWMHVGKIEVDPKKRKSTNLTTINTPNKTVDLEDNTEVTNQTTTNTQSESNKNELLNNQDSDKMVFIYFFNFFF